MGSVVAVVEEHLDRADAGDGERAADPDRVGDPVQEVVHRPGQVAEGQPGPEVRAAFLREGRAELGEQQRLRDEEDHREDHHPGEGLTAALGDGGDRVHADDRADEEEQDVEAAEVALQLLTFDDRGGGHRLQSVGHRGKRSLPLRPGHIFTPDDVGRLPIYDIADHVMQGPRRNNALRDEAGHGTGRHRRTCFGHNGAMVSEIFEAERWRPVEGFSFTDITYHRAVDSGTVRVAFNRPEVRNAFRPHTVDELYVALDHARMSGDVGCVLLTGNGPSPRDGGWAFCSGGDQRIRGRSGYQYAGGETAGTIDPARAGRLHIMEVHRLIRFMPKVVICVVPGWAAGGGHSLHVVCDLTLASREHARFKQTDADVGSFDGGFGSAYLARQVGQKFAREIFFLGDTYDAEDAHRMGMVNAVVPHADLERTALEWAAKINAKSPTSQRMLKFAFNLIDDGLVGQQVFSTEATRLAYMTDEAVEGRDAFLEKRDPDWTRFPYYY